jgi:hypothetical protein
MTRRRALVAAGGALLVGVGVVVLAPLPTDPEAWTLPPPRAPAFTPTAWPGATRVDLPDGHGPEDVERLADGTEIAGLADGRLVARAADGAWRTIAETGGRPLGLHPDPSIPGAILVADAFKGLLRVAPDGVITTLATECGGVPLVFTDDLETDARGGVWFTDASQRHPQTHWKSDLIENRPSGRLCRWDPRTERAVDVLVDLAFANGVAVDPEGAFVLVNETARYRVRRVWLDGPKAGTNEIFIDDLPGFPDGISAGSELFWIAVASPRNPIVDALAGAPRARAWLGVLPEALQPAPARTSRVIGIDRDGVVRVDVFDPTGADISVVTSVQERDGWLLLGSLTDDAWARMPVPRAHAP